MTETIKTATKKAPKAKPAAPKAETNGHVKKDGLRKPQLRILVALAKGKPLSRKDISAAAPVDVAACVEYVGSTDKDTRLANDAKHFPSLISLGFVKVDPYNDEKSSAVLYSITAGGRKALEKASKLEA